MWRITVPILSPEGVSIGSASIGGNYTINPVSTPDSTTEVTPVPTPTEVTPTQEVIESTQETPQNVETPEITESSLQASLENADLNNGYLWIGLIVIIILGFIYCLAKKKKK